MTAPTVLQDIAAELVADGDECEVGAWTLRLTVETDQYQNPMADMVEGEWYGRVESAKWVDYSRAHWEGHYTRPDWADGGAELLRPHFMEPAWWRPADDVVRDHELRDRMRTNLLTLLEFGYQAATVEAWRHRDIYGRGCVEAVASIGGLEPLEGVIEDVVPELVAEVLEQIRETE
jgi:hypothetical protein